MPAFNNNGTIIDLYSYMLIPFCKKGAVLNLLLKSISDKVNISEELQGYLASRIVYSTDHFFNVNGMVHNDLKPDNYVVTDNDEIALIDFGHALNAQCAVPNPKQIMLGTQAFMAPEVKRF